MAARDALAEPVAGAGYVLVPWDEFVSRHFRWAQGEHVALIGPTGQGKTTLALALAAVRHDLYGGHVGMVATKPNDSTLAALRRKGWQIVGDWRDKGPGRKVLLWPRWKSPKDSAVQQRAIHDGIWRAAFVEKRWCIIVDDVQYLCEQLRLRALLVNVWLMARSLGVSLVGATQRPVKAPREMFASSSHFFLWGTADADDLRSLSGLGMADTKEVRRLVSILNPHDVLYVDGRRPGVLVVTRAPRR